MFLPLLGHLAPRARPRFNDFAHCGTGPAFVEAAQREVSMRTLLALVALGLFTLPAHALERDHDGYFHTGEGVRYKKIAFINIKVYAIDHYMKDLPPQKSKQAVINADVDKRFSWKMLRSVDAEKIR